MLFDKENMFFDGEAASGFASGKTSPGIYNHGGGDAIAPLYVVVQLAGGSGKLDVTVQTATNSDFSDAVDLATFFGAKDDKGIVTKAYLPYGCKDYVRIKLTGTATGKVTAGLTDIVPIN
ncbi:hypothetical protein [uncultured Acidaminococcus sp.]|uniref:hypothetical protein n=1 Tax=uncultured Acidaminococcus sp. TaxID=352152 RepID=UPI0025991614|nr:hypothetical protein [uncultured Acidaminococcus sp.]